MLNRAFESICENRHWQRRHISRLTLPYTIVLRVKYVKCYNSEIFASFTVMLSWQYGVLYICTLLCFWETFCNYPPSVPVYVQCVCCCSVSPNGSWRRKPLEISPLDTAWMICAARYFTVVRCDIDFTCKAFCGVP